MRESPLRALPPAAAVAVAPAGRTDGSAPAALIGAAAAAAHDITARGAHAPLGVGACRGRGCRARCRQPALPPDRPGPPHLALPRPAGKRMAESEAETPSTPGEFESKYFEYNGVRLPPFCRGKMEEIANFPVRDSDVWIVTYPKSGRRAGGEREPSGRGPSAEGRKGTPRPGRPPGGAGAEGRASAAG